MSTFPVYDTTIDAAFLAHPDAIKCPMCWVVVVGRDEFSVHLDDCPGCEIFLEPRESEHKHEHPRGTETYCAICDIHFENRGYLEMHLRRWGHPHCEACKMRFPDHHMGPTRRCGKGSLPPSHVLLRRY